MDANLVATIPTVAQIVEPMFSPSLLLGTPPPIAARRKPSHAELRPPHDENGSQPLAVGIATLFRVFSRISLGYPMYTARYIRLSLGYPQNTVGSDPMPIVLKRKVMRIGNSLRVAIPKEIVELLQLKQGDSIEFAATNGDIVIRKSKK